MKRVKIVSLSITAVLLVVFLFLYLKGRNYCLFNLTESNIVYIQSPRCVLDLGRPYSFELKGEGGLEIRLVDKNLSLLHTYSQVRIRGISEKIRAEFEEPRVSLYGYSVRSLKKEFNYFSAYL